VTKSLLWASLVQGTVPSSTVFANVKLEW